MAAAPMRYQPDGSVDWGEHVPVEVKQTFELQARLERLRMRVLG